MITTKEKQEENKQDVYSVVETSGWMWRIFATIIVVPKGVVGNRKYITSNLLMALNFFLSFAIIASSFGLLFNDQLSEIVKGLEIDTKILISIKQSFNFIIIVDMIIWKMMTNNKFKKVIDSLATQDEMIKVLGCRINYKSDFTKIKFYTRLVISVSFLMSCQEVFYGFSMSTLIDWTNWWLPTLILKSSLTLFFCLVWMLGVRFGFLNEKLSLIVASSSPNPQVILNIQERENMLRTIAKVHGHLCKIGQNINSIFMLSLITCTLETFVFVTLMLYRFILEAQHDKKPLPLVNNIIGVALSSSQISFIVFICNWTKNESLVAEKLIHKIKLKESNRALFELVQAFSLQMLHQKLTFSVGGLFTLDPALLQAISGAITTYLIILIQFGDMNTILLNSN